MKIEISLIRHGLTKSNEQHRYLGKRTDEELSEKGVKEAVLKKTMITQAYKISPDFLFYGPMRRCIQTSEILFDDLINNINVEKMSVPEWTEIDFGQFEGKNYIELSGDEDYQNWIDSGGTLPFPGGEDRADFIERSYDGFVRMIDCIRKSNDVEDDAARSIAVLHGGNIMSIMYKLLGGNYYDYQVKNLEGYRILAVIPEDVSEDISEWIKIIEVEKIK